MAVMSFLLAERNMKTHTQNGLAGGSVPSRVPPLVIKLESRNVNDCHHSDSFLHSEGVFGAQGSSIVLVAGTDGGGAKSMSYINWNRT